MDRHDVGRYSGGGSSRDNRRTSGFSGAAPLQNLSGKKRGSSPGHTDHQLYVWPLSKKTTEKEVEKIFSLYGKVEETYLIRDAMQQSRGYGFVRYSRREMAVEAINELHGNIPKGCDQPLVVRFADTKIPRTRVSRDPTGNRIPPNPRHSMNPPNIGPSSDSGDLAMPLNQSFNQSSHQIAPLQKPLQLPLPPTSQLQAQATSSYSQAQVSHTTQTPFRQALPVHHASQPLLQQSVQSTTVLQAPSYPYSCIATNQQHQYSLLPALQQSLSQLQANFHSSQQEISQLHQQLQMIQQSQPTMHQYPHNQAAVTCNWSEHITPDGEFKYYYNSVTKESKWQKPEELSLLERQQQLQPTFPLVQQFQTQPTQQVPRAQPMQHHLQVQTQHNQQVPHAQPMQHHSQVQTQHNQQVAHAQPTQHHPQVQTQFRQQQPAFSSAYAASQPRGQL